MAKRRLKDRPCAVNPPPPIVVVGPAETHTDCFDFLEFIDTIDEGLAEAKAMLAVSQFGGLENCEASIQHKYLSILDDLLQQTITDFNKLTHWYRTKT